MEKKVYIIHGCPSNVEKAMNPKTRTYDKHWMPWIKKELALRSIETEIPLMPEPWAPDYEKFKKEFEKNKISEDDILIGHSCGCAFLVRWLGDPPVGGKKISKLILVAPWKITEKETRKSFYDFVINETIKFRVKEIVMFTSDNEEENGKKSLKIYHDVLGGEVIELKNHGHYVLDDMGTEEFPELLEVILR